MTMGGFFSYEMMMQDGTMHNCPYMGVAALCNMTPLEHLSQWQQMFSATAQQLFTLALLSAFALLVTLFFVKDFFTSIESPPRGMSQYKYRERIFDPLRLAFARGIVHPKVY